MSEERDGVYGKYNEDGSVTEAKVSILTGNPVAVDGSIREAIPDSRYFYRFEGTYADRVTDEIREQWRRGAPSDGRRSAAPQPMVTKKPEQPE